MAHYLVTGGAGFIGSHTVDALLARGHRVTVLDDFSSGKASNLPKHESLKVITGDIRDAAVVSTAVHGVDGVLHLAAQVSVQASVADPCDSASRNLSGFLNVLDAARRHGVPRFVYASSAAVYGQPAYLPLDETAPTQPASPYGLEKLVNDQYAGLYRTLYGTATLGLRYFNVYGPRQDPRSPYAGVLSRFKDRIAQGEGVTVFGDGEQTRDFIEVGHIAEANCRALEGSAVGVLNVATGHSVTLNTVITTLSEIVGRPIPVDHQPARDGDIVHSASRNAALLAALGPFSFMPLRDGLARLLASS